MKKNKLKTLVVHVRTNNNVVSELDKIAKSYSVKNKKEYTRSDIIRISIDRMIHNYHAK